MNHTFLARYDIRDRVEVDADPSITGRILRVMFHDHEEPSYEVSWFVNGAVQTAWIDEYRLTKLI